jgi:protein transport protein SEC24
MRATTYAMPVSSSAASAAELPVGIVVRPFAAVERDEDDVPLVDNVATGGPVRCRRCRAYHNVHDKYVQQGTAYQCAICSFVNEVPPSHYAPIGLDGRRHDVDARPELLRGSVDFVATSEYMARSPTPAALLFVIDVSQSALASGTTAFVTKTIKETLASLAGQTCLRVVSRAR